MRTTPTSIGARDTPAKKGEEENLAIQKPKKRAMHFLSQNIDVKPSFTTSKIKIKIKNWRLV